MSAGYVVQSDLQDGTEKEGRRECWNVDKSLRFALEERGCLLGQTKEPWPSSRESQKKQVNVDFRDQRGIYALYDDRYNLVYVGQAGKATGETSKMLFDRLRDHRSDNLAERWTIFSWFGTRGVQDKDNSLTALQDQIGSDPQTVLDHMEGLILATADPPKNQRGPNFGNAVRYEQTRDDSMSRN